MRHTLALSLTILTACEAGDDLNVGQEQVDAILGPTLVSVAEDPGSILDCLDIPDPIPPQWIRDRLAYRQTCFDSWVVSLPVADCPVGGHLVDGEMLFAGTGLASLPKSAPFIRLKALTAAVIDLGMLLSGNDTDVYANLVASDDQVALSGCVAPEGDHGYVVEAGLSGAVPLIGDVAVGGSAEVTYYHHAYTADFSFSVSAEPPSGPAVVGDAVGSGLANVPGELCPDTGEVAFTGTIGGSSATLLFEYVGDGQVEVILPNGDVVGPFTPPLCQ